MPRDEFPLGFFYIPINESALGKKQKTAMRPTGVPTMVVFCYKKKKGFESRKGAFKPFNIGTAAKGTRMN